MILYHGTNMDFNVIDLKKSKPGKDFGQGFYLSDNLEQAQALAQARVELVGGVPTILSFQFNERLFHRESETFAKLIDEDHRPVQLVLVAIFHFSAPNPTNLRSQFQTIPKFNQASGLYPLGI